MKKFLGFSLIFFVLLSIPACMAESWDDIGDLDRAWDGQKTITNQEFEKVMDALEAKSKKKEVRKRKRKARKISGGGTSLHSELNPDNVVIPELESVKTSLDDLLINLPVYLIVDGKKLEKGYYNVTAEKDKKDGKIYINLYQAHYLKAKVEANETENDYGQEEVNFAQVQDFNDNFVRLIYGCVDFNAYVYIPFTEE